MTTVTLQRLDGVADARDTWTQLDHAHDNIFGTWEWASAWCAGHVGRRVLPYAVHHPQRGVVALLPLYVAFDRGVRLLRFIGHGVGDQLGPICAPADRPLAAEALRQLVTRDLGPRYVLLAEGLRCDEGWRAALGGRVLARESFPVLTLEGGSWDAWLAARSGHFRRAARRFERALVRDHALTFKRVTDATELPAAVDVLIRLHRARWGSRSAVFETPGRRYFYERMLPRALERGWLRLWLADAGGHTVAAWLGFRYAGAESYYQGGRDPAWDRTSVGLVLLLHTIREALADGMSEYRFLRGDEPYKRRLQTSDPAVATLALGAGPLPGLLAAQADARRLARSGRDRVLAHAAS